MADAVKALTHWRRNARELVRAEHTREVVKEEMSDGAKRAIVRLADEVDGQKARIARLERVIADLHAKVGRA